MVRRPSFLLVSFVWSLLLLLLVPLRTAALQPVEQQSSASSGMLQTVWGTVNTQAESLKSSLLLRENGANVLEEVSIAQEQHEDDEGNDTQQLSTRQQQQHRRLRGSVDSSQ